MISLVIPAYNEAAGIVSTLQEAVDFFMSRGLAYEIIVSADGTDGTREAARQVASTNPNVQVIGSEQRRGKGYGIRAAVLLAVGDVVGFVDADNKTPITEFDKFASLLNDGVEVVIGSRGVAGATIEKAQPWHRRVGSRGFGVFMQAAVGLPGIKDTQCGFKFFQGNVARDLFTHQAIDGYMYDVEILYIARQRGYRIVEIPVRWRDDGDSRLDLVSGNVKNVRDILSIRWRHRRLAPPVPLAAQARPPGDS